MFSRIFFKTLGFYYNMGAESSPGTPRELANEMLDKLPQNIWSDPTKTFLEPCFSNGMFYFLIIERLFSGLADIIPEPKERIEHILTKQVWAYETNKVPYLFVKKMLETQFGIGTTIDIQPNICYIDVLKEGINMKFDVVVMNPPYQAPKNGNSDTRTLWNKFVENSIKVFTKEDGYVCAVHPAMWRKATSNNARVKGMFEMMTHKHHMEYLEIHDTKDGLKTFNAGTRYDWYVIAKNKSGTTLVKDQKGNLSEIDLKKYKWLPNHSFKEVSSLFGEGTKIIYDCNYKNNKSWVSEEKSSEFPYPLVHTTKKKGTVFYYSSRNDKGHFGISKVIFGESGINDVIVDVDGKYGMTSGAMAIQVKDKEDALKAKDYLLSERFKNIIDACKWSNFRVDWSLFTYFKEGFWRD